MAAAANTAPGGAATAIRAVADGGRLATITSDPPRQERGITVANIVCYLSVGLSAVVAGVLAMRSGLRPTPVGYGIILAVPAALAIPATLQATVRDDRIRC